MKRHLFDGEIHEVHPMGAWVLYDDVKELEQLLSTSQKREVALTKERDCWIYNANELQKAFNLMEKREAMLRDEVIELKRITVGYVARPKDFAVDLCFAHDRIKAMLESTTPPPYIHEDRLKEVVEKLNQLKEIDEYRESAAYELLSGVKEALTLLNELTKK